MYFFAISLDWERNFKFVQSMCHSLEFEECSKPKFKSVGRFPRSIKYGMVEVPPIAITWWEARAGGSVTSNVVLYLNKVVTEKCTLTTLILMYFPMML